MADYIIYKEQRKHVGSNKIQTDNVICIDDDWFDDIKRSVKIDMRALDDFISKAKRQKR